MQPESVLSTFRSAGVEHIKLNEPLARHTTWRIGGPADVFVTPASVEELQAAMRVARQLELPWTVIGKGSNLLVQDAGIRGLVIKMGEGLSAVSIEGCELMALAGRSYMSAANMAIKQGLGGLEFAAGIPGTVGGAVMMNAGAHGGETKDVLIWADVLDDDGVVRRLTNSDLQFGYRYSILKDHPRIVVAAAFKLYPDDTAAMTERRNAWLRRRANTQPLSLPNCGSVFRNPEGTHAGFLIESAGLKGLRRGGAQISDKHANFIVNTGNASASDVLWLMRHAQETVRKQFGIELETEVRIVGEPSSGR
ncbi:MAG: UDP-N-acetylmuramate dehydrogenase [Alicyclobacillus sp.]|nr:UDP-N-acetylmuramate dehydrogenase [Alicyclobacillus sp.]